MSTTDHRHIDSPGFSLVELLVVIAVLGVLAAITVFTVRGTTRSSEQQACASDRQTMEKAADYYLAETQLSSIPPTGSGADRFEQTLVDADLLASTSTYFELSADGTATAAGSPCA